MRCFIFIHGHAGSVGQAALIAKTLFELDSANYKVFVIHSNEGLSALDSHILLQQAHFVVHSIKHLQTAYKINRVTILAHSMGGIVARLVFTLPDYVPGSIETLVTFATPHLYPPVSIEQDMVQLYASVNQFWRFEFSSNVSANSSLVFGDLVVVSIAGGLRDLQIQSQFSDIGSIVPSTHGVSVFTSGIPGVWRDLGHEGILTCPPLMEAVAQSFLKERGSRQERIDAWNWNLL
ncbi:GPI inositol-deacylase PGAP1-like protein, partial [Obelidium mucronatum]